MVDEVHERSVDSDLLLLLLREYKQKSRSNGAFPRVVLMSATADEAAISSYWTGMGTEKEPIMSPPSVATTHIPGRTFPVSVTYLEDAIEASGYGREGSAVDLGEAAERQCMVSANASGVGYTGVGGGGALLVDNPDSFVRHLDTEKYCSRTLETLERMIPTLQQKIDYQLLVHVIKHQLQHSATNGAIIVFLPGLEDIKKVISAVQSDRELATQCTALPMHSSLSFDELQSAFRPLPMPTDHGSKRRKLIVSTNICETGVTIEDVDLVIDSGFVKSMEWNEVTEFSRLRTHRCSVAEAMQRRGRAGRVRAGACVHMFPRCMMEGGAALGNDLKRLKLRPEPEMARAPLTSPILSLVEQDFHPQMLLRAPGNTVAQAKLDNAINALVELDALVVSEGDSGGELNTAAAGTPTVEIAYAATALGRTLAALPCDPRSGKILLAARQLGCLHSAAVFIASLDCKNIFLSSDQSAPFFKKQFVKGVGSDVVAVVNAYTEWSLADKKYQWCRTNSISMSAMQQVAAVARDLMGSMDTGGGNKVTAVDFPGPGGVCLTCRTQYGQHSCVTGGSRGALHAAICVGMGRKVAHRASSSTDTRGREPRLYFQCSDKSAKCAAIHRSSLVTDPCSDWIVYCSKMLGSYDSQTLSGIGSVNLATVMLFSTWVKYFVADGTVVIGNGIGIKCAPQTLVAIRKLRYRWNDLLINDGVGNDSKKLVDLLLGLISMP